MMNTGLFTKDLGTILVGAEAVNEGIINEVGGLKEAMEKELSSMTSANVIADTRSKIAADESA